MLAPGLISQRRDDEDGIMVGVIMDAHRVQRVEIAQEPYYPIRREVVIEESLF